MSNADYRKNLELKYYKYGKSLIGSYEKELVSERSELEGIIGEHEEWKEFFSDWNNWSEKERRGYLYFLAYLDDKEYLNWFLCGSIIVAFLIGFSIGR